MIYISGLVVVRCGGYILVGVAFVLFVRLNGGIVVGDRSAHQAVLHLPQLLYFALFFAALTASFTATFLVDFFAALRTQPRLAAGGALLLAATVQWNTLAHPYLLADNRHLTFYIWRRFFARHWAAKFLPIPAYMFGLYGLGRILKRKASLFDH